MVPTIQSSGRTQFERDSSLVPIAAPPILGPTPGQSSGISQIARFKLEFSLTVSRFYLASATLAPPMLGPTPGQSSGILQSGLEGSSTTVP